MDQLYPAGNKITAATLGSGVTSQHAIVHKTGSLYVDVRGTFDGATATLQYSPNGSTWETFAVDLNGSGTGTAQTWDGTAGDINPRRYVLGGGMMFRVAVSAVGSPAITARLFGDHYTINRES